MAQGLGVPAVHRGAGEELVAIRFVAGFLGAGEAARRVAGAAVAQALHQVGAPVPLRALGRQVLVARVLQVQGVPQRHQPAHAKRPGQLRAGVGLHCRLYALHEVGIKVLQVGVAQLGKLGVGHGRVKVVPVLGTAFAQCPVEVLLGVATNAVAGVGCDVGGDDGAKRRGHGQAAGKGQAASARVAADAVARAGQVFAALHGRQVGRGRCCEAHGSQQAQAPGGQGGHVPQWVPN